MLALARGDTATAIRQQADTSGHLLLPTDDEVHHLLQLWQKGAAPLRGGTYADTVSMVFELRERCYVSDQLGMLLGFKFVERSDRWVIAQISTSIC